MSRITKLEKIKQVHARWESASLLTIPAPGPLFVSRTLFTRFVHRCVITNQIDVAKLRIAYRPVDRCAEIVSLRDYLCAFTYQRVSHEEATTRVRDKLAEALAPLWLVVHLTEKPRGYMRVISEGIATHGDPPPYELFSRRPPRG